MSFLARICIGYLLFLFAGFFSLASFADTPINFKQNALDAQTIKQLNRGYVPFAHIIESEIGELTPRTAITQLNQTDAQRKEFFDYGFSNKEYWIGFTLHNLNTTSLKVLTEIDHSLLDNINYYVIETTTQKILQTYQTGDKRLFKYRPIKHPKFVFPLKIEKAQTLTLIFKISTNSASQFPIRVWSPKGIDSHNRGKIAIAAFLIGTILIFGLYNLLLFFSLRDSSYLYLAICSASYATALSVFSGFGYFYIWPESIYWNEISLPVTANMVLASLCLFTRQFLSLEDTSPALSKTLLSIAALGAIFTALSFILPYSIMSKMISLNTIASHTVCYTAGFILVFKQERKGYIYLGCLSLLAISSVIFLLGKMNILTNNIFLENAIHIGVLFCLFFLCLALADRVNEERKQRENAQRNSIENLEKYHSIYKRSIEGIFRFSLSGELLDSNPAFTKMLGIEEKHESDQLPKNLIGLVPKYLKDNDRLLNILSQHKQVIGFEALCKKLSGDVFWGYIHAKCVSNENAEHYIDASIIDITEKVKGAEKLKFIANHDILTGLSNRLDFEKRLGQAINSAKSVSNEHALLFMDLDQFKIINDTAGHSAGDELLKQMSVLFKKYIRINDSVARLGGDEFVILMNNVNLDTAEEIANRLREEVSNYRFYWKKKVFSIGISIGIVPITKECTPAESLLSLADTACYIAKDAGRNNVYVYKFLDDNLPERQTDMKRSHQLSEAINNNSLLLYQQKILDFNNTMDVDYYEVLVRMQSNNKILLPGSFLAAAERFDHLEKLDLWVIDAVLQHLECQPACLKRLYQVNINISGRTISSNRFEGQLLSLFDKYHVPKEKICFEITESTAISNLTQTSKFLMRMRQQGFKFALDDFGSGFSSFSHLKALPISSLKIDGSFIKNIATDPIDKAMVKSITDIAHMMGITVTAEFVENETILSILQDIGVDSAQGFYIHKPELLV